MYGFWNLKPSWGEPAVTSVDHAEGLHENTLRDWKKQASVLEDSAETHGEKKNTSLRQNTNSNEAAVWVLWES